MSRSLLFPQKLDRKIQMAEFKTIRCLKYAPQLKRSIIVKSVIAPLSFIGALDNWNSERKKPQVVIPSQFEAERAVGWLLWS